MLACIFLYLLYYATACDKCYNAGGNGVGACHISYEGKKCGSVLGLEVGGVDGLLGNLNRKTQCHIPKGSTI